MAPANGKISGVPACPKHPGSKVRRFGTYGVEGHKRQRWQCVWDKDAEEAEERKPHTFTEALPRKHTSDSSCAECERGFSPHEGHQTPRTYSFTVKDIASALVAVGEGVSYRQAANRVRRRSGRLWTSALGGPVAAYHASIVCDWVEVYGPVVTAGHGPSSWPEVVGLGCSSVPAAGLLPERSSETSWAPTLFGAGGCWLRRGQVSTVVLAGSHCSHRSGLGKRPQISTGISRPRCRRR